METEFVLVLYAVPFAVMVAEIFFGTALHAGVNWIVFDVSVETVAVASTPLYSHPLGVVPRFHV